MMQTFRIETYFLKQILEDGDKDVKNATFCLVSSSKLPVIGWDPTRLSQDDS